MPRRSLVFPSQWFMSLHRLLVSQFLSLLSLKLSLQMWLGLDSHRISLQKIAIHMSYLNLNILVTKFYSNYVNEESKSSVTRIVSAFFGVLSQPRQCFLDNNFQSPLYLHQKDWNHRFPDMKRVGCRWRWTLRVFSKLGYGVERGWDWRMSRKEGMMRWALGTSLLGVSEWWDDRVMRQILIRRRTLETDFIHLIDK